MHDARHSCCDGKLYEQSSFETDKPTSGFDGGCCMVLALFRRMFLRGPLPCLHPHHTLAQSKGDRQTEKKREREGERAKIEA
ncbi:hypothetical protein LX36DRAFT_686049 [Colletotrichum falcatum]|nr:hypothetical protein LX36DRAFT_686049 [Colletotrichum falcatum]